MAKSSDLSPKALKRLHEIGQWARRAPCSHKLDRSVLREIADHADWKTCEAFPSVDTIAQATLIERNTVMTCISRMLRQGLLEDTLHKAGHMNRQRIYRLPVNGPSAVPFIGDLEPPLNGDTGSPMNGDLESPTLVRFLPPLNGDPDSPKPSKKGKGAYQEAKTAQPAPPCSASEKGGSGSGDVATVVDFISIMQARHLAKLAPHTRKPRTKKKTTDRTKASAATDVAPALAADGKD